MPIERFVRKAYEIAELKNIPVDRGLVSRA
jgi:hypothetical protein